MHFGNQGSGRVSPNPTILVNMRLLYVTNLADHHQLPIVRCIATAIGNDNFRFVATAMPDQERKTLGWSFEADDPWILRTAERERDQIQAEQWWRSSQIVLCEERLLDHIAHRLNAGGIVFYASERWWKTPIGIARLLYPPFAAMARQMHHLSTSPLFHYLPQGGYAAKDMKRIADFDRRTWDWGYFSSVPSALPQCERAPGKMRVLWAGRLLPWKRVDTLIKAFGRFLDVCPDSLLTVIGRGPEEPHLKDLASTLLPQRSYEFVQAMPPEEVRKEMRSSHIYVLPSDGGEGWGVVLNEAMTEGCAVVACEDAGAAKSLIADGKNGFLFHKGDSVQLAQLLIRLGTDVKLRINIAREGQQTISEVWSPDIAATRFLSVCDSLLAKRPVPQFDSGPMRRID